MLRTLAALFGLGGAGKAMAAQARGSILSFGLPEQIGFDPAKVERIDEAMRRLIGAGQIAGGVTLLARRGRIISLRAHGQRDLASGDPMLTDAIFRIRSETKPVTGVAMLMLLEQGLIGLDDPITQHIPQFSALKVATGVDAGGAVMTEPIMRPPTIRELMTHTAGFAYGLAGDSPADRAYLEANILSSESLQDMIDKLASLPMYCQPGTMWRYSIATDIQGYLVEKLSGQTLPEFMRTRIFEPLGMKDTGFFVPAEKLARLATLYDAEPATGRLVTPVEAAFRDVTRPPPAPSAGGGLVSTAMDYARFCQMLLNSGELEGVRLLKPETVALMRENHLPPSFTVTSNGIRPFPFGAGMGFGLNVAVAVDPAAGNLPVGKGTVSWGGSAGTWFWVDPQNDLFFVGMIQRLGGVGGGLDGETRHLVYQALADRTK